MCNNCIHKIVCSKYIATGGVKSCEHHKEERKGRWIEKYTRDRFDFKYECSICNSGSDLKTNYCPHCGFPMGC